MNARWSKLRSQAPWGCGNCGGDSDARQLAQQKWQWCLDDCWGCVERWMMWLLSGCNGKWITTRCMMMHSWPHKNGEHSDGKNLGSTVQGLWCKTKWVEWWKHGWMLLSGVSGCGSPNSLWQHWWQWQQEVVGQRRMLWVQGTLGVLNKTMELNTCNMSKPMIKAMQVMWVVD